MEKCRELVEAVKAAGIGSDLHSDIIIVVRDKTTCIKSRKGCNENAIMRT